MTTTATMPPAVAPRSAPMPRLREPWGLSTIKTHGPYVGMPREAQAMLVEHIFERWYPPEFTQEGCCLHWTHAACVALRLCGERSILQAGTMYWPCLPMTEPERATHFGYEFTPHEPESVAAIERGALPELHCWCALPDKGEIIDFSTRSLRYLAENKYGLNWETPDPPRYFWGTASELPEGVIYSPSIEAIRFVLLFLESKTQ